MTAINASDAASETLRAFGLGYPDVQSKSPWPGHGDLAVSGKTFAYLSAVGQPFSISCKLPYTAPEALAFDFSEPTGYGLGRSGWVTASWPADLADPISLFMLWIDESYRAQAPKRLIKIAPTPPNQR